MLQISIHILLYHFNNIVINFYLLINYYILFTEKFVKNNKPECNIDTKNDRLQDVIAKQKNEIHTLKAELTVLL